MHPPPFGPLAEISCGLSLRSDMCWSRNDSTHCQGHVLCDLTDFSCLWLLWSYDLAGLWAHCALTWRCTRSCGMPSHCQDPSQNTSGRRLTGNVSTSSSTSCCWLCGAVSCSHLVLLWNNRKGKRGEIWTVKAPLSGFLAIKSLERAPGIRVPLQSPTWLRKLRKT